MKQFPKRTLYKKYHKPTFSYSFIEQQKNTSPSKGSFALVSRTSGKLTYKQIESGRRSVPRKLRKGGFVIIRPFTYVSLTKKPLATRMGKGKGSHHLWIAPIRAGQILYEIKYRDSLLAFLALSRVARKMPFRTKVVPLTY